MSSPFDNVPYVEDGALKASPFDNVPYTEEPQEEQSFGSKALDYAKLGATELGLLPLHTLRSKSTPTGLIEAADPTGITTKALDIPQQFLEETSADLRDRLSDGGKKKLALLDIEKGVKAIDADKIFESGSFPQELGKAGVGFAESMTEPQMLPLLFMGLASKGPKALQVAEKALVGMFAQGALSGGMEGVETATDADTPEERNKGLAEATLSTLLGGFLTKHATKPPKTPPPRGKGTPELPPELPPVEQAKLALQEILQERPPEPVRRGGVVLDSEIPTIGAPPPDVPLKIPVVEPRPTILGPEGSPINLSTGEILPKDFVKPDIQVVEGLRPKKVQRYVPPEKIQEVRSVLEEVNPELAARVEKYLAKENKKAVSEVVLDPATGKPFGAETPANIIDPYKLTRAKPDIKIPTVFQQRGMGIPEEFIITPRMQKLLEAPKSHTTTGPMKQAAIVDGKIKMVPRGTGKDVMKFQVGESVLPESIQTTTPVARDVVKPSGRAYKGKSALDILRNEKDYIDVETLSPEARASITRMAKENKKAVSEVVLDPATGKPFGAETPANIIDPYKLTKVKPDIKIPTVFQQRGMGIPEEFIITPRMQKSLAEGKVPPKLLEAGPTLRAVPEGRELRVTPQGQAFVGKATPTTNLPDVFNPGPMKQAAIVDGKIKMVPRSTGKDVKSALDILRNEKGYIDVETLSPEARASITRMAKESGVTFEQLIDRTNRMLPKAVPMTPQATSGKGVPKEFDPYAAEQKAYSEVQRKLAELKENMAMEGVELDKADIAQTASRLYKQARVDSGLKQEPVISKWAANDFYNTTDTVSNVMKRTGIDELASYMDLLLGLHKQTHVTHGLHKNFDLVKLNKRAKKLKVGPEELNRLMTYVDTEGGKPGGTPWFNPEAMKVELQGKEVRNVPEFKGGMPSPRLRELLFDTRRAYDRMFTEAKKVKPELAYARRHMPVQDLVSEVSAATLKDVYDPSILKQRSGRSAVLNPDFWENTSQYLHKLAKRSTPEIWKAMADLRVADWKLRAMGRGKSADLIKKNVADAMGFKDLKGVDKFDAEWLSKQTVERLKELREEVGIKPDRFARTMRELEEHMYYGYIGSNVRNSMVAQNLDFVTSGAPEMGIRGTGRVAVEMLKKGFSKADDAEVARMTPFLRDAHYNPFEDLNRSWKTKALSEAGKLPGKPGMWMLDHSDMLQRKAIALVAKRKFMKTPNAKELMDGLTELEQRAITKAAKVSAEEAAEQYGIQMAQRIMKRYSRLDKPPVLKEGVGEHILFTTHTRGELAKFIRNVANMTNPVQRKQAIKRLAYPAMIASTIATASGSMEDFWYFMALAGSPALLLGTPAPYVGSVVKSTMQYGPKAGVKQALKGTALTKVLSQPWSVLPKDWRPKGAENPIDAVLK